MFPLFPGFPVVTSARRFFFGTRTDVFLPGKAEIAVKTRRLFLVD
jgi:hypothetical protein